MEAGYTGGPAIDSGSIAESVPVIRTPSTNRAVSNCSYQFQFGGAGLDRLNHRAPLESQRNLNSSCVVSKSSYPNSVPQDEQIEKLLGGEAISSYPHTGQVYILEPLSALPSKVINVRRHMVSNTWK